MKKNRKDAQSQAESVSKDPIFEGELEEENDSDLSGYQIRSYPSDFTLKGIYEKWNNGDIYVPTFQRAYVWSVRQASRLIDSFLLGLPVPPVFLYEDESDNRSIIIDGQQRIKSIVSFFKGEFPNDPNERSGQKYDENDSGNKPRKFRLRLEGKYSGLSYSEMEESDRRKLDNSVLRAVNIFQQKPENQHACMYHVFERLNTGGTRLNAQEIRNCVWEGNFNEILKELNLYKSWRNILGRSEPHKRLRDVELILLIFAFHGDGRKNYKSSLKKYLNYAMEENISGSNSKVESFVRNFKKCADLIDNKFGDKPCHFNYRVNEQVLEALFCVIIDNINSLPHDIADRFLNYRITYRNEVIASKATADSETVKRRYDSLLEKMFE